VVSSLHWYGIAVYYGSRVVNISKDNEALQYQMTYTHTHTLSLPYTVYRPHISYTWFFFKSNTSINHLVGIYTQFQTVYNFSSVTSVCSLTGHTTLGASHDLVTKIILLHNVDETLWVDVSWGCHHITSTTDCNFYRFLVQLHGLCRETSKLLMYWFAHGIGAYQFDFLCSIWSFIYWS